MRYEIAFTLGSYVLLLILTIIYFHNQRFNTARNQAYKGLLVTGLCVSTFEVLFIYGLTTLDMHNLTMFFYKLSLVLHVIWWVFYLCYFVATATRRDSNSLLQVIKENKIVLGWTILAIIEVIVFFFINVREMSINTINFLNGGSASVLTISATFTNLLLLMYMSKSKDKTTKMERFAFFFGVTAILIEFILQYIFKGISFIPSCYSLIIYVIYFCAENPDIQVLSEISEAQGDIEQSNQTKTDFLSNMTYEIKTPMNLIQSLCDELINMPTFDEKLFREDIGQIVTSGNSMLDIVNNILDISKIETGKQVLLEKDYKVVDLLTDVVNITKSKIGAKQVKLMINVDQNIASVLNGDYSKLYQVLTNIMANSAKFTEVGRITFTLSSTKNNNIETLLFKITDTGTGIKEEEQGKIFEKGTRLNNATDSEIEGSGFGLAITKQYVETLGGKIWFESKFRVGSTFYIEVPQKIVDATPLGTTMQQQQAKPQTTEKLDCSAFTVLIVDDNLLNIKVAKRVLEGYKFNVESVTAGKDCVYKIKEGVHYDAIFMDHMMPEMDGIETLHVLKKLDGYELPPIIALTANAVAGMKEMYLAEGFDDYLSKPINAAELDRVVNKFFNK